MTFSLFDSIEIRNFNSKIYFIKNYLILTFWPINDFCFTYMLYSTLCLRHDNDNDTTFSSHYD